MQSKFKKPLWKKGGMIGKLRKMKKTLQFQQAVSVSQVRHRVVLQSLHWLRAQSVCVHQHRERGASQEHPQAK